MKIKPLLCLTFMFLLGLTGCNKSIENRVNYSNENTIKGYIEEFDRSNPYNIPEQVDKNIDINNSEYNTERASNIAKVINNFEQVDDTTVIIVGNTALIGIDLISGISEEEIGEIKKLIEEKTFLTDTSLKNVSITTSEEMVKRIKEIAKNLREDRKEEGLVDEINSIIRRITPTI
ncbi:YhcN/YlaJ family sporulation lipoprotein [Defluviitalea phaphyphila]|uniref:YhcN/YlaJ family sporulation lipoprotein n=1 Tax=Defluviitalea phaphyphila TaxID=1473580 RepID=UPI0007306DF5|nr:YhcN/YlaJ family sporulation lipoprotein [Defluviitalea phaphyphila]